MPINGHPKMILERQGALASVTSELYHMLGHLRRAHHDNHIYALGLELPSEKPIVELIGQCATLHKKGDA